MKGSFIAYILILVNYISIVLALSESRTKSDKEPHNEINDDETLGGDSNIYSNDSSKLLSNIEITSTTKNDRKNIEDVDNYDYSLNNPIELKISLDKQMIPTKPASSNFFNYQNGKNNSDTNSIDFEINTLHHNKIPRSSHDAQISFNDNQIILHPDISDTNTPINGSEFDDQTALDNLAKNIIDLLPEDLISELVESYRNYDFIGDCFNTPEQNLCVTNCNQNIESKEKADNSVIDTIGITKCEDYNDSVTILVNEPNLEQLVYISEQININTNSKPKKKTFIKLEDVQVTEDYMGYYEKSTGSYHIICDSLPLVLPQKRKIDEVNVLKRNLKRKTPEINNKRRKTSNQALEFYQTIPENHVIQKKLFEFNKPKKFVIRQKGKKNNSFREILKIIRKVFKNKRTKGIDSGPLDFDIDFMIQKIFHYCSNHDLFSFEEEISKNNIQLDMFIDEYVKQDIFIPLEVYALKFSENIKRDSYLPFNKVKNMIKIVNIKESEFLKTLKCKTFTPIKNFSYINNNGDSYVVLFGSRFILNNFTFCNKFKKSTFCYFIARQLLLLRSLYSDIPELICIDMLISPEIEIENLIKIYLYLNIICVIKNPMYKILAIIDEILKLLDMNDRLRDKIIDNIEPEIYTDLLFIGYGFLSKQARKFIILEFNKRRGTENISQELLKKNYCNITHKILVALTIKLFSFTDGIIGDLKDILVEYSQKCNNLNIDKIIRVCRRLYWILIEKNK
ncbi:hypothetical protein NGRA_2239 [Nosema granulosis]|uniref:Uncharacterized protein n=1 Tax=Nosema granulosis TaxID=83296 RepID=A0A9P6GXW8_9MICR|nr:hypothetical protein NGRA_2239 [Nosema granulosis]